MMDKLRKAIEAEPRAKELLAFCTSRGWTSEETSWALMVSLGTSFGASMSMIPEVLTSMPLVNAVVVGYADKEINRQTT